MNLTLDNGKKVKIDESSDQKALGIWAKISEQLLGIIGTEEYERWIAPLKVLGMSKNYLILECENSFEASWINNKYSRLIDTLMEFHDTKIKCELVIKQTVPESSEA